MDKLDSTNFFFLNNRRCILIGYREEKERMRTDKDDPEQRQRLEKGGEGQAKGDEGDFLRSRTYCHDYISST